MNSIKKILLVIALIACTQITHAQSFEWVKSMGGVNNAGGGTVCTDITGNIYISGYFEGTADFDPGSGTYNLTSAGNEDVFIVKLDAYGNFLWAISIGGSGSDYSSSLITDSSGNVYLVGFFEGTVDFDPGANTHNLSSAGYEDVFILKLDVSGSYLWAKSFGGYSQDFGQSIKLDVSGNIFVTGMYEGLVDFDPGTGTNYINSAGQWDAFILKLDGSGNFIWAKSFGGSSVDQGLSVNTDANGNVYTTGNFSGTADFDPGSGTYNLSATYYDVFVQKLDGSGNFIWAKAFCGPGYGYSINLDPSGFVYTTGAFQATADFDPGAGIYNLTSEGGLDVFVQKMDTAGNFIWARSFGGSSDDFGKSNLDASQNIYTTGHFQWTVDFDPGSGTYNLTSAGNTDAFIQKMDSSGNLCWVRSFGNTTGESASSCLDSLGNIYTTGYFEGTVDFNLGTGTFNLTSAGGSDFYVQKLSPCGNIAKTDVLTACDSMVWIDGNTYTANNNSAVFTLLSTNGCDSVVTLDLTINTVDVSVTNSSPTLSANAIGASYQWLDCDNNMAIIPGETSQSFTVTTNGNYAVIVTQNNCIDTSSCETVNNVGIGENEFGFGLVVYPNPSSGNLIIALSDIYERIDVIIKNYLGQKISTQTFNKKDKLQMNIEGPAGIYFIEINADNKKAFLKVIKE